MGPITHEEIVANMNSPVPQRLNFFQKHAWVDDYPICNHALHMGAENAARYQRQFKRLIPQNHGMASIRTALVPNDNIVPIR
jgi:hypothetical protein